MARELAILVTAKNMASGVLKDVRGDVKGLQSEVRRGAATAARNTALIGAAAAGAIAVNVKAGIDSLAELERMQAQTNAVITSTQGAAGLTAEKIRSLAEEYENLTTVDDKAVQNTENLLLTFTNVRKDAFEPALAAILDMNAAMGGDENSLEGVAIQVGKALNDPIKGITALSRVGVTFTEKQKEQIKTLVESNDLFGAQQIILGELSKEFGGSAAAQADTYAGKMRRVEDAVEGAQMALATAFLPVLEKVADKLETFLSDPETLKNIEEFGGTLAEGLDDAIEMAGNLPWDAIGSTFAVMGAGAKTVLQMFTSMPPWVQTAILTGWGLNKLTGGALGNIVGSLGSGLIKGVLGMNAGVVNINAAVVNGGPGGVPAAGGKGGGAALGLLGTAGLAGAALAGITIAGTEIHRNVDPTGHQFNELAGGKGASRVQVEGDLLQLSHDTGVDVKRLQERAIPLLQDGSRSWASVVSELRTGFPRVTAEQSAAAASITRGTQAQTDLIRGASMRAESSDRVMLQHAGTQAAHLSAIQGIEGGNANRLEAIKNKKSTVNVTANVTANVDVSLQSWERKRVAAARANTFSSLTSGI